MVEFVAFGVSWLLCRSLHRLPFLRHFLFSFSKSIILQDEKWQPTPFRHYFKILYLKKKKVRFPAPAAKREVWIPRGHTGCSPSIGHVLFSCSQNHRLLNNPLIYTSCVALLDVTTSFSCPGYCLMFYPTHHCLPVMLSPCLIYRLHVAQFPCPCSCSLSVI